MATRPRPYSSIGPYHRGVWLIAKGRTIAVVDHSHLPPQSQGFRYFWLGTSKDQVVSRLSDGADALGLPGDLDPQTMVDGGLKVLSHGGRANINNRQSVVENFLIPAAGIGALFGGGAAVAGAADAAGSAGAADAGAAGSAAGGTGAGTAAKVGLGAAAATAISDPLDFLKFIAWIFHPRNILRIVEFLTGIVLLIFGFQAALQARGERIEGFSTSENALSRSGLGRVSRELASASEDSGGRRRRIRPRAAPHTTRRTALRVRYEREQKVARRQEEKRRKS